MTLELSNVATLPIKLWPGMKIGQLCLFRTSSPAEHPYGSSVYGSRYQGQRGPTPSRSYLNFHRADANLTSLTLVRTQIVVDAVEGVAEVIGQGVGGGEGVRFRPGCRWSCSGEPFSRICGLTSRSGLRSSG